MEQFTQWGVSLSNTFRMKKHLKSRNPALNIPRRHEAVATDTVISDTPAVGSGVKQAQVFVGRDTLVADAYPMNSGKQFVNTDTIYIKTQVFRLLRYYSQAPRNIARSDWATQNITHNMTSSIIQPYGAHSP